jgi:DNA-binding response OmpR family regulator
MSSAQILVVEDDRDLLELLAVGLESQGYRVTRAANVSEALQAARESRPDLLLLDLTLLDADPFAGLSDGFAFLQMFRRNHPDLHAPVIIHSGDDSPETAAHAQALGVFAVLRKGCAMGDVLSAIQLALISQDLEASVANTGVSGM